MATIAKRFEKQSEILIDTLKEAGARLLDASIDAEKDAAKQVNRGGDALVKLMKGHPIVGIAIGVGVGFLVARALTR